MASIVVVCPSCGRKLETSDRNVGRDGQCPSCQTIFEIPSPYRGGRGGAASVAERTWLESAPAEYRETSAVSATLAVFIMLLVLGGMTSLRWTQNPLGQMGRFIGQQKLHILTVSVACCAFLFVSALTHKSLLPGVLLSGAWATVGAIWIAGLLWGLEVYKGKLVAKGAMPNMVTNFTASSGMKAGLIVSLLLVTVSLYAYYQYRRIANLRHFLLVAVLTEVLAVLGGATVLYLHGYAEVARIGEATI